MSVWEVKDESNPEQKAYMRILSNPSRISEKWLLKNTDGGCYEKSLSDKLYDISINTDIENKLKYSGFSSKGNTFENYFTFSIENDTLTETMVSGNFEYGDGYTIRWVKSKVNVDDLKLCD